MATLPHARLAAAIRTADLFGGTDSRRGATLPGLYWHLASRARATAAEWRDLAKYRLPAELGTAIDELVGAAERLAARAETGH
jgi:hypothetical protein